MLKPSTAHWTRGLSLGDGTSRDPHDATHGHRRLPKRTGRQRAPTEPSEVQMHPGQASCTHS